MTEHHDIVVVGAGMAGLILARILTMHDVDVAVYEAEPSADARAQGGLLDMHEESGQAALHAAGLYDQFLAAHHAGGQGWRILDKHAVVGFEDDEGAEEGNRPEIHRKDLRRILLESLPEGVVRWGAKVARFEDSTSDRPHVTLEDGLEVTAGLLAGADGAYSRCRRLFSDATPQYLGVTLFETNIYDAANTNPRSAALAGHGSFFALDDEKAVLAQCDTYGDLRFNFGLKVAESWATDAVDFSDVEAVRTMLRAHFADWDSEFQHVIDSIEPPFIPRPLQTLPIGLTWQPRPGITLLGDAAHLMSPFAGEGANLAMQDGLELARAILDHPDAVNDAIAVYEQAMYPRSAEKAQESADNLEFCFAPDGRIKLVEYRDSQRSANAVATGAGVAH
jgi:2-polyprenyl-6-methoxyphenol hydroxylase-like FAD-dependent oxidoreductase